MPATYEIIIHMQDILADLEASGGEVTPEIEAATAENKRLIKAKTRGIWRRVEMLKAEIGIQKDIIAQHKAEIERLGGEIEDMHSKQMQLCEAHHALHVGTKIKTEGLTVSVTHRSKLVIEDGAPIPDRFYFEETKSKLDRALLTNEVKAGVEVEGCTMQATKAITTRAKRAKGGEE